MAADLKPLGPCSEGQGLGIDGTSQAKAASFKELSRKSRLTFFTHMSWATPTARENGKVFFSLSWQIATCQNIMVFVCEEEKKKQILNIY